MQKYPVLSLGHLLSLGQNMMSQNKLNSYSFVEIQNQNTNFGEDTMRNRVMMAFEVGRGSKKFRQK